MRHTNVKIGLGLGLTNPNPNPVCKAYDTIIS